MTPKHALVTCACLVAVSAGCGRGNRRGAIVSSGHVEATEVRVASKVGGTLAALLVEEGDAVKAGQRLATLDTTDTRLALEAARGDLATAEAELRLRRAGARREDLADGQAQVERAEAEVTNAQKDLERMEGLLTRGSGTTKARDDARLRRDVAAAALASTRERLAKLEAGNRFEEIDVSRARAAAAAARVAQLEQQLKDATIVCPVDGIVTERLVEVGELAARGTAVAVVTEIRRPWLTVYVGEPDLGRVRLGQEVEVITDNDDKRTGTVSYISSKAEFTPKNVQTRDERVKLVYRVKVRLPNDDLLFKPGMPAEARFR